MNVRIIQKNYYQREIIMKVVLRNQKNSENENNNL